MYPDTLAVHLARGNRIHIFNFNDGYWCAWLAQHQWRGMITMYVPQDAALPASIPSQSAMLRAVRLKVLGHVLDRTGPGPQRSTRSGAEPGTRYDRAVHPAGRPTAHRHFLSPWLKRRSRVGCRCVGRQRRPTKLNNSVSRLPTEYQSALCKRPGRRSVAALSASDVTVRRGHCVP